MKEFQEFPAWRYGPNGEAQIFKDPAEVPEDWTDKPQDPDAPKGGSGTELNADDEAAVKALIDDNSKDDLIAIIDGHNDEADEANEVEYLDSWPKRALALAIFNNKLV